LIKGGTYVNDPWGVAVYKDKDVVWGQHSKGKENGAVILATNTQDTKTYLTLENGIDGIQSLASEYSAIYYTDLASKIYRAKHNNGKFEIDMVHDKIPGISQIGVLDKYLYAANSTGLYVLKTSSDKATKGY